MEFVKSLNHPEELLALLQFKTRGCDAVIPRNDFSKMTASMQVCYQLLQKTSRSFAAVIQALDPELRDANCLFYLALRSLDTVEDDMSIPKEEKIPLLRCFHTKLQDPDWRKMDCQDKDRIVLEQFPIISKEFRSLKPEFQTIIADITARMGEGMVTIMESKVNTMDDYNMYCYYVAGLVGEGMVRIMAASGVEDPQIGQDLKSASTIGMFLQRTNIIRDYLEDIHDTRVFWPKCIWSKYSNDIGDFAKPENRTKAVQCMNELIADAIEVVPHVIRFAAKLKNQSAFNYVVIPQVMAVATLERCYNNPAVFTGVVKIRKGESVRMMLNSGTLDKVKSIFAHYIQQIQSRIPESDPSSAKTHAACRRALEAAQTKTVYHSSSTLYSSLTAGLGLASSMLAYSYWDSIVRWYNVEGE